MERIMVHLLKWQSTPTAIASLEARIAEHQLQSSELSDRVFSEVFSEV
jgi:hypothetical protein